MNASIYIYIYIERERERERERGNTKKLRTHVDNWNKTRQLRTQSPIWVKFEW